MTDGKAKQWQPEELKQWQARLGLSQAEAARQTNTPVSTYRHYLIGIRRIPGNFALLCRYRERFGDIEKV